MRAIRFLKPTAKTKGRHAKPQTRHRLVVHLKGVDPYDLVPHQVEGVQANVVKRKSNPKFTYSFANLTYEEAKAQLGEINRNLKAGESIHKAAWGSEKFARYIQNLNS